MGYYDFYYKGYYIKYDSGYYNIFKYNHDSQEYDYQAHMISEEDAIEYINNLSGEDNNEINRVSKSIEDMVKDFQRITNVRLIKTYKKDNEYVIAGVMGYSTAVKLVNNYNKRHGTNIKVDYNKLKDGVFLYF